MKLQKIMKMYTSFENNMDNLLLWMTMKKLLFTEKRFFFNR